MFEEALEVCDPGAPALVVTRDGWHPGVMGIVASKLLERHFKPVFIIAAGKGSVRSTPGISAVDGLRHAAAHLKRYGGHSGAAGFAILEDRIPAFRDAIHDFARAHPTPVPTVLADALLEPREVTAALKRSLEALEPFGTGHPEPVFAVRGPATDVRRMGGGGRHLAFRLGSVRGKQWDGERIQTGDLVDAAVTLEENDYKGRVSLEFTAEAVRYAAPLSMLETDLDGGPTYPRLSPERALEVLRLEPGPVYAEGAGLAYLRKYHPHLEPLTGDAAPPGGLTLFALPEPARLGAWLRAGVPLRFALGERTLSELESRGFWTLERLKDAARRRARGETIPPRAAALLEALDPEAPGVYRASLELALEEAEAYRLAQFCRHHRHADDAAFATAVRRLYGGALPGA
jgi:single-stranded-DNA-specific exonuclease